MRYKPTETQRAYLLAAKREQQRQKRLVDMLEKRLEKAKAKLQESRKRRDEALGVIASELGILSPVRLDDETNELVESD